MSNALAIAGVTAVLKDLLDNGLIDHVADVLGTGLKVSALAPDAIRLDEGDAVPRLNLFLHQVTPNPAYRNVGLPSRDAFGNRVGRSPLALDLHYLVTAYAGADLQTEVLLGYAMQLLHETPILAREAIRKALNPPAAPVVADGLPPIYRALRASDLANQIEQIKISPEALNSEEMSKLWTALQAHYRPTAAYHVSVVLIESSRPSRSALPVLTRGPVDPETQRELGASVVPSSGAALAQLTGFTLPESRDVALLGDSIIVNGEFLDGSQHTLVLANRRLGVDVTITPADAATSSAVTFTLKDQPDVCPAGIYAASLMFVRTGETQMRNTDEVPFCIAATIQTLSTPVTVDNEGTATISVTCSPALRPEQSVSLVVGDTEVVANAFDAPATTVIFRYPNAPPGGPYRVRLRVDGVDSVIVDRTVTPPVFIGNEITIQP